MMIEDLCFHDIIKDFESNIDKIMILSDKEGGDLTVKVGTGIILVESGLHSKS